MRLEIRPGIENLEFELLATVLILDAISEWIELAKYQRVSTMASVYYLRKMLF